MDTLKLLVVDDDPDLLEICTQALELEGYNVDTAHNGGEALRKLYTDDIDGVLLDIMMPGIDGITVCKTIRHDPRIKEMPIVIMSASHIARQQAGACSDAVLAKPFELDHLVATMRRLV